MRTILMAAMLATASTGFAADTDNEELMALIEAQQKQIELLQQQLDATRSTLTQLRMLVVAVVKPPTCVSRSCARNTPTSWTTRRSRPSNRRSRR